jgi:hypothetical protein
MGAERTVESAEHVLSCEPRSACFENKGVPTPREDCRYQPVCVRYATNVLAPRSERSSPRFGRRPGPRLRRLSLESQSTEDSTACIAGSKSRRGRTCSRSPLPSSLGLGYRADEDVNASRTAGLRWPWQARDARACACSAHDHFRPPGPLEAYDRFADRVIARVVRRLTTPSPRRRSNTPEADDTRGRLRWSRLMGSPRARRSVAVRIDHRTAAVAVGVVAQDRGLRALPSVSATNAQRAGGWILHGTLHGRCGHEKCLHQPKRTSGGGAACPPRAAASGR